MIFKYLNDDGDEIIVVREGCKCFKERKHLFRTRVKAFCFFWKRFSWHKGLYIIAIMTIFFEVIKYAIVVILCLASSPSGIQLFFLFPTFHILNLAELIAYLTFSIMLLIGIIVGNLKLIKSYPWGLLSGYLFSVIILIYLAVNGEKLLKASIWHKYGMSFKSSLNQKLIYFQNQIIFYVTLAGLEIFLILFTTYMIILALSCIDSLEDDVENINQDF